MERRTILKGLSATIAGACAAVTAAPLVRFLLGPLSRRATQTPRVQRVATLDQIPVDQPKQFAITGDRQDAWTLYPRQVVGRVWLVRRTDAAIPPENAKVDAYSAECPHLGCAIDWKGDQDEFVCPCHQAAFDLTGQALSKKQLGYDNPSPRNMDQLTCRVIHDQRTDQWWVEVEFQRFKMGVAKKTPV